jgi:predicted nucleic acid-binding protein
MLVFDSSTLILVAKIDLLEKFLGAVGVKAAIPQAVEEECWGGRKTFDELIIRKLIGERKIDVMPVRDKKLVSKVREDFNLGKGEAEAIALALREKALLLGIDDRRGINACKLLGIPFSNAIDILVRRYQKKVVDQGEALARLSLLGKHGWYNDSILDAARRALEEG